MAEHRAESAKVYPRPGRVRNYHLDRRWILLCDGLVYDNGIVSWERGYRTRLVARLAAFWHYYIGSWGGGVVTITDTRTITTPPGSSSDGEVG